MEKYLQTHISQNLGLLIGHSCMSVSVSFQVSYNMKTKYVLIINVIRNKYN